VRATRNLDASHEILPVDQGAAGGADRHEIGYLDQGAGQGGPWLDNDVDRDLDHEVVAVGAAGSVDIFHRRSVCDLLVGRDLFVALQTVDDAHARAQRRRLRRAPAAGGDADSHARAEQTDADPADHA
jgi:hypothetical protein